METKLSSKQMEKVCLKCGFGNGIDIDAIGSKGGLSLVEDFNKIMHSYEKKGGRLRSDRQMSEFRDVLDVYGLNDVGFVGRWFTWERERFLSTSIRERLDRGVASLDWISFFSSHQLEHLSHSFSDHCPILLDTHGCDPEGQRPRPIHGSTIVTLEQVKTQKRQILAVEYGRSTSKALCFFHKAAVQRFYRNRILGLEREDGSRVSTNEEMLQLVSRYFENLFTASSSGDDVRLLGLVDKRISNDMNEELLKLFTEEDILHDVKSIPPLKAPDDCILFGEASLEGANLMHQLITEYDQASGQRVNFDKSFIYFRANVELEIREIVTGTLGVRVAISPEKYLGLPMMIGKKKK
ncbi:hypothetical protein PVK06_042905 [Gossypium arboreum]|uniref:Reverse transcriptase n=1 Tax=Gossypium arboreum TaxID=29729 RepID=A0ABR0MMG8_GOSAR|nr:hypothetical protein PVK06_042905 [Gossypium arboreum]